MRASYRPARVAATNHPAWSCEQQIVDAVDIIDLEVGHFRHAQASAIGGAEYGFVFSSRRRFEQLADFLDTQHRR